MKEFPDAPLIRYRTVANTEVLVCNSLNSHKELLQTKCYSFRKPDWWLHTIGEMTGRGIVSMEGEEHRAARRSLAGAFSLGNIRKLEPVVRAKAKDIGLVFDGAIAANKSGECGIIDCTDTFSKLTLDIIGVAMLGIDLANITSATFGGHENDTGEKNRMADGKTEDYTFHDAYNVSYQIIRNRRRQVAEAMSAGKYVRSESCDMPTYVIEKSMPGGLAEGMPEKDFVGHSKLRDEITALVAQVPEPTYTEIDHLQYLDHFIKENLRMFSPATTLHRKSIEDLTIEGTPIPKGTLFDIVPSVTSLNPLIWGNDADEIKPSRWEHLTEEQSSPYAFEAFSNGPRICLGRLLAYMELKLIFFEIIRNYRFLSVVKPFTVESPSLTLRPRGLEVRLEKVT
ncbi:hypothetical protein DL765_006093 [Monosporascus sp. GIB2]|nr:hypothetical protein DL765_006093 [Monosporascus sp. GIB2]